MVMVRCTVFVTTGHGWQMIEYDGVLFRKREEMVTLFEQMDTNQKWLLNYSIIVDCLNFALHNGGIAKDVVVTG